MAPGEAALEGQDFARGVALDHVTEELERVAAAEEAEGAAPLMAEAQG